MHPEKIGSLNHRNSVKVILIVISKMGTILLEDLGHSVPLSMPASGINQVIQSKSVSMIF